MTRLHSESAALLVAMFGLATPGFAQDGLCGGSGSGGQWIGGDEASSDITTAGNFQEQMALVLGGNEYVALFKLSETTDVRVEAAGRGAGDPIIDLLDANGGVILSDDDSGGNGAARAETTLDAGSYCMSLRGYDGGPMTAFVRIGRTDQEPLTDGITEAASDAGSSGNCASATPIGPIGTSVTAPANETAYWSFTVESPIAVSVTADNETADPSIKLFDGNAVLIDENDDFDGLNSRIDVAEPLAAGTYCIAVEALSDDTAPITINLTEYDPEAALLTLFARGEASPPLDGSYPVTALGVLQSRLREDVKGSEEVSWFTVDIDEPGLMLVEAIGTGGSDPWLIVYDDLGRELAQNDDYGNGLDSLAALRVDRGTYVIGTRQYEGNQGLIRLLVERYVRAQ